MQHNSFKKTNFWKDSKTIAHNVLLLAFILLIKFLDNLLKGIFKLSGKTAKAAFAKYCLCSSTPLCCALLPSAGG